MVSHVQDHSLIQLSMISRYSVLFADGLLAVVLLSLVFLGGSMETKIAQEDFLRISPEAAESVRLKIASIRQAAEDLSRDYEATIEISEVEMESFVLYEMVDEIPAKVESIDIGIEDSKISAFVEITFPSQETGNLLTGFLIGGTHSLFVQGRLEARNGRGTFELLEVRLDGLPMPILIVEALVDRFVTPQYPQVDLGEPFEVPWGVEGVWLSKGNAVISY